MDNDNKVKDIVFEGSPAEMIAHVKALEHEYLKKQGPDEKRAFDCVNCGDNYIPYKGQWIFWDLCDKCFSQFDEQKMAARISQHFGDGSVTGFESVDEWMKSLKNPK